MGGLEPQELCVVTLVQTDTFLASEERRLVRAAILYADVVLVGGFASMVSLARTLDAQRDDPKPDLAIAVGLPDPLVLAFRMAGLRERTPERAPLDPDELELAYEELSSAQQADALIFEPDEIERVVQERGSSVVPVLDQSAIEAWVPSLNPLIAKDAAVRLWHEALATSLISQLEAFPDASIDVLLDVRQRLERPRTHFRAAIARAAQDLADAGAALSDTERALADLRLRVIDPALAEMRHELDVMGARPTLLRLTQERLAVGAVGASATLAVSLGDPTALTALAHSAAVASIVAAGSKEMTYRKGVKRHQQLKPFWMLHEAAGLLKRA